MPFVKRFFFIVILLVFVTACQKEPEGNYISEGQDILASSEIPTSDPIPPNIIDNDTTPDFPIEDTQSIDVFNIKIIYDDHESNRVIGLVINRSEHWITNIKLEIQIFDPNDNPLVFDTTTTVIRSLASGKISPFRLNVKTILPKDAYAIATVTDYDQTDLQPVEVLVRKESIIIDDRDDVHLIGEIYNHNLFPIIINNLAGATFDSEGNLSNTDTSSIHCWYLDPGEISPFRATLQGAGKISEENIEYKIYIDASITNPEDYLDLEIDPNPNHFLDRSGVFHLVGEITNQSEFVLDTLLLAAIYDSSGTIIDVATTRLPILAMRSGETLPFEFNAWGPLNYKEGTADSGDSFSVQWDPYWIRPSDVNYISLAIEEKNQQLYPTHGIFSGTFINTSTSQISKATVIISVYDIDTGILLAMNASEIMGDFLGESTTEYEITLDFPETIVLDHANIQIRALGKTP